jgi:hypothetical protein
MESEEIGWVLGALLDYVNLKHKPDQWKKM